MERFGKLLITQMILFFGFFEIWIFIRLHPWFIYFRFYFLCNFISVHYPTFDDSIKVHFKVCKYLIWSFLTSHLNFSSLHRANWTVNLIATTIIDSSSFLLAPHTAARILYRITLCGWVCLNKLCGIVVHCAHCQCVGRIFNWCAEERISYSFCCCCLMLTMIFYGLLSIFKASNCLHSSSQCGNMLCHLIAIYI